MKPREIFVLKSIRTGTKLRPASGRSSQWSTDFCTSPVHLVCWKLSFSWHNELSLRSVFCHGSNLAHKESPTEIVGWENSPGFMAGKSVSPEAAPVRSPFSLRFCRKTGNGCRAHDSPWCLQHEVLLHGLPWLVGLQEVKKTRDSHPSPVKSSSFRESSVC